MTKLVTIVIPISRKHRDSHVYLDAISSAKAQTIPCDVITVMDTQHRGAAWARNQGTAQVKTPFVVYLDADDLLRPSFVEDCLNVYRAGSYVYTDWVVNGLIMATPDCLNMWGIGQEHVITTLLPTIAWRSAGGFDESLNTLEDEDFYRRLHAYGWNGVRCPEPLIEYRRTFGESLVNKDIVDADIQAQRVAEKHALFTARYKQFEGLQMAQDCGCNGGIMSAKQKTLGEKQPNDVLVETLYSPQKVEGAVTRRLYPRAGLGKPMWVDEDDARSRPDLFRMITENPITIAPDVATVKRLVEEAIAQENKPVNEPSEIVADIDYTSLSKAELETLVNERNITVVATGARGRVTKDDLIVALS